MSRSQRVLTAIALVFCGAAAVVFWTWRTTGPARVEKALPVLGSLPDFQLIDQDGETVTRGSLRGEITAWQLICNRCETASPLLLSRFAELDQNFRRSTRLKLVSVTTDPLADEPAALARLRRRYEASSHWVFVTGHQTEIVKVIAAIIGVTPGAAGDQPARVASDHPVFVLVDEAGRIRERYPGLDDQAINAVLDDAGTLLRTGRTSAK